MCPVFELTIFAYLGFVGVFLMYVTAVLFLVEARIMRRKEIARESTGGQFNMEKRV